MESDGDADTVREVYERAIANVPPLQEKRHWRRYIYLWINYALYEELETKVGPQNRTGSQRSEPLEPILTCCLAGPREDEAGLPGVSGAHPSQEGNLEQTSRCLPSVLMVLMLWFCFSSRSQRFGCCSLSLRSDRRTCQEPERSW